ncbi:unnamed protein product, partial [Symbiodinium microadriaticum]
KLCCDQGQWCRYIQASLLALAAILADESVVTWGDTDFGGDSTVVQHRLRNVKHIQASEEAFAAIRADGAVVTWGNAESGGDSSVVQDQLQHVQHIQASEAAFAAIRADGSVVTWGKAESGGDSSAVQDQLHNVKHIQDSFGIFSAILADGSVVTWGMCNTSCRALWRSRVGIRSSARRSTQVQPRARELSNLLRSLALAGKLLPAGPKVDFAKELYLAAAVCSNRSAVSPKVESLIWVVVYIKMTKAKRYGSDNVARCKVNVETLSGKTAEFKMLYKSTMGDLAPRVKVSAYATFVDKSTNKIIPWSNLCRRHPDVIFVITREDEEEESLSGAEIACICLTCTRSGRILFSPETLKTPESPSLSHLKPKARNP